MNKFSRHSRFSYLAMFSVWVIVVGLCVYPVPSSAAIYGDSHMPDGDRSSREQGDIAEEEISENVCPGPPASDETFTRRPRSSTQPIFKKRTCYRGNCACSRDEDDHIYVSSHLRKKLPECSQAEKECAICHGIKVYDKGFDGNYSQYANCRFCLEVYHRSCIAKAHATSASGKDICPLCRREDWKETSILSIDLDLQQNAVQNRVPKIVDTVEIQKNEFITHDEDYLIGNKKQRDGVCVKVIAAVLGWNARDDMLDKLSGKGFNAEDEILLLPCCDFITCKREYIKATTDCSNTGFSTINRFGQCPNFACESRWNSLLQHEAIEFPELQWRADLRVIYQKWKNELANPPNATTRDEEDTTLQGSTKESTVESFSKFVQGLPIELRQWPRLYGYAPAVLLCASPHCDKPLLLKEGQFYRGKLDNREKVLFCNACVAQCAHDATQISVSNGSSGTDVRTVLSIKKASKRIAEEFCTTRNELHLVFARAFSGDLVGGSWAGLCATVDEKKETSVVNDSSSTVAQDKSKRATTPGDQNLNQGSKRDACMSKNDDQFHLTPDSSIAPARPQDLRQTAACLDCGEFPSENIDMHALAAEICCSWCDQAFCRDSVFYMTCCSKRYCGRCLVLSGKFLNGRCPSADCRRLGRLIEENAIATAGPLNRALAAIEEADSEIHTEQLGNHEGDASDDECGTHVCRGLCNRWGLPRSAGLDAHSASTESKESVRSSVRSRRPRVKLLNSLPACGRASATSWELRILDEILVVEPPRDGHGKNTSCKQVAHLSIEVDTGYGGDKNQRIQLEVVAESSRVAEDKSPNPEGDSLSISSSAKSSAKSSNGVCRVTVADVKKALQALTGPECVKMLHIHEIKTSTFRVNWHNMEGIYPTTMEESDVVSKALGTIHVELGNEERLRKSMQEALSKSSVVFNNVVSDQNPDVSSGSSRVLHNDSNVIDPSTWDPLPFPYGDDNYGW